MMEPENLGDFLSEDNWRKTVIIWLQYCANEIIPLMVEATALQGTMKAAARAGVKGREDSTFRLDHVGGTLAALVNECFGLAAELQGTPDKGSDAATRRANDE